VRWRAWGLVPWVVLGCEAVDAPRLGECGNGIVEVGEDCEPVGDAQRCGAAGTGARSCRFVCDVDACPDDHRCGLDEVCRQACVGHLGEPSCSPFETLSTDVTSAPVADLVLLDVDGDERPEIATVEIEGEDAFVRIHRHEGDAFVGGAAAPTGGFPLLTRLDADGPIYLIAPRTALPASAASATQAHREAVVSVAEASLEFREVLMQGPTVVAPGPLALASLAIPADVPGGGGTFVLGFRDGEVWRPSPTPIDPVAPGHPDDLLGPAFGQPIASATDALASRYCAVMLYGYTDGSLHAYNPCEDAAPGWASVPLALPELPAALGDGLVLDDANGDGLDDVVITTRAGRSHVAYAVGDGTFHSDGAALPSDGGDGRFDDGVGAPDGVDGSPGVIAVDDFNGDERPDFITRSTWIRSCDVEGCGTCDVPGYRCDVGGSVAPIFRDASVIDRDGEIQLAALESGGGDLVIIADPATPDWSASVVALPSEARILANGDLDGDRRDEVVLMRALEQGDELLVVFGRDDSVQRVTDFARIVDAHVVRGTQTLAVVSEDLDGAHRRLSTLTATIDQQLRSTVKLPLQVVPRQLVGGRFGTAGERGIAVLGEGSGSALQVELLTRGGGSFFDASTRRSAITDLGLASEHATRVRGIAVDLDGDEVDELVVFAPDGVVRTLRVGDGIGFDDARRDAAPEPYGGAIWPPHGEASSIGSAPRLRDLDGDGDLDVWLLTLEDPPRLAAFRNRGDGSLDVAGRALTPHPPIELSICEATPDECRVRITAFAAFAGPSDRTRSLSDAAVDVLLVSHRALFHRTLDAFAPDTALAIEEVAVVRGERAALGPPGAQILVDLADIDGDGIDDALAGGPTGLRWLRGLAVNP
jgi:hypothetical protein